jgi:hypothetical protein
MIPSTDRIDLQEWARARRALAILQEEQKSVLRQPKPKLANARSLFGLTPQPEDFIPTHDPKQVIHDHVEKMKEVAGIITDNYDAVRRAEKEAKGQIWQTSRRTSKRKAADLREAAQLAAEEEGIEFDEEAFEETLEELEDE